MVSRKRALREQSRSRPAWWTSPPTRVSSSR